MPWTRFWSNAGPPSATLVQHWANIAYMSRVCLDMTLCLLEVHKTKSVTNDTLFAGGL